MLSKLLGYSYDVIWIPGKKQTIADALSRNPVFPPEEENETDVLIRAVICQKVLPDLALQELSEAAMNDDAYKEICRAVDIKKPLKDLPTDHPGRHFTKEWDFLRVDEVYGLLLFHDRIVVPKLAKKKILELLHVQHTGITKTYNNARQLYFWFGMKNDIVTMVRTCEECTRLLPSQPLEPKISTFASRPFEAISLDLGKQNGKQHLIMADRYSGWPNAVPLTQLDTNAVIKILEDWFIDMGKPERIRSDGGPQFRSEFTRWCKKMGIHHELSSAYHHESNGHAEVSVREMKRLLNVTRSWRAFREALREYRNTPRHDGLSPAQWLFGRRQRTNIPAMPQAYNRLSNDEINQLDARRREEVKKAKKDHRGLPHLTPGQLVIIQDPKTHRWVSRGTVTAVRKQNRSYIVDINGRSYLRNRRFLRPCLNQDLPHHDEDQISHPNDEDRVSDPIGEVQVESHTECSSDDKMKPTRRSSRRKKRTVRYESEL